MNNNRIFAKKINLSKNMKKLALALAVVSALTPAGMFAQETARLIEPARTEFNPHWSMQLQVGGAYTVGEADKFKDLVSPAAALNFGYSFSPAFTLRFGGSGWMAKGAWVSPYNTYKYNYVQGNVDAVLSFTNLFCGFNPSRTLDFYGFLGVGGNYAFNNDEAVRLADAGAGFQKLWRNHRWGFAARGGLGLNIWVSSRVAINVEANANMLPDNFNSKRGSHFDWQYNGLVGVTIRFGKNKRTIPAVYEEIVVEEPAPEPAPAPAPEPEPAPAPVVEKAKPITENVFFIINSSKIRQSEAEKIAHLVEYMNTYPESKVTVTGYADKNTGTSAYNMTISERRAAAVSKALQDAGIAADRITVKAMGDTEQPFDVNKLNRVAIAVAAE